MRAKILTRSQGVIFLEFEKADFDEDACFVFYNKEGEVLFNSKDCLAFVVLDD